MINEVIEKSIVIIQLNELSEKDVLALVTKTRALK